MKPVRNDAAETLQVTAGALAQGGDVGVSARPEQAGIRLIVEQAGVLSWATDRELRVTWGMVSQALAGLETTVGAQLDTADPELPAVAAHLRALAGESGEFELEWKGRRLRVRVEPLREDSRIAGAVAVALVAEDQEAPPALTDASSDTPAATVDALHDPLTGLPTRSLFLARLRRSTAPVWCAEGLYVLLLDLDRFREVNDRHGYAGGDQLLAEVAGRLKRRVRSCDTLARIGPDEFAVLLARVGSGRDVARVAERLLAELSAPFEIRGQRCTTSASIGVALGQAGARAEDVIREAERSLARAQVLGRPGLSLLPAGDGSEASLVHVETALRRALDQEEIRTRYRPTVLRKEGKVAGFEVVLWRRAPAAEAGDSAAPARVAG
jgi:diguanylate cyclase (GGDEF)-like protein